MNVSCKRTTNVRSEVTALHKKWKFPLRTSLLNVTKSAGNFRFGHIY